MTTRSGRPFRAGEMAEQALQDMLRKLIEDRQKREEEIELERVRREEERIQRDKEIAEERARREERVQREKEIAEERTRREERLQREREIADERTRREGEAREKSEEMRAHMDRLIKIVEEQRGASAQKVATEQSMKLVALTELDNIESYLVTFERIMAAHDRGGQGAVASLPPS